MEKQRPSLKETIKSRALEATLSAVCIGGGIGVLAAGADNALNFVDSTIKLQTQGYFSSKDYDQAIKRVERDLAIGLISGPF